ncbi:helix-turn-helix domain-containing protein [Tenacibaculum agarivorans]|uniref:helix-turn-helix domain-containing protein n=1 Tax=Tenacibaculum agarivorans TaxID=1908389 RepID=UPI00094B8DE9|nr:helix-turn-helix transcriptional regulator [Tenacibaculum agarivorans]
MIQVKSIVELSELFGFKKPTNPLIAIIDMATLKTDQELLQQEFVLDMYCMTLKDEASGVFFGRKNYDFGEGVMVFSAPNQVLRFTEINELNIMKGWMLFIHPDLIKNSSLAETIENYKFFSYDTQEALHLSDSEQDTINECLDLIKEEISKKEDNHSRVVLVSILNLLFNLCNRFYERQFNTRSTQNNYIVTQVNSLLKKYYREGLLAEEGIPNVEYLAKNVNLSPNYLSDLLKKETGKSAKEYINYFVIDKAKTLLMNRNISVSVLAYELGFNYPHYFSRLFKAKTGVTPQVYRKKYEN